LAGFGGRLRHWGALAIGNPWAFLATLVVGGAVSFVYSYVPLHTVKDRKLDTFHARVVALEAEIDGLVREVDGARSQFAEAPDADEVRTMVDTRDRALRDLSQAEAKLLKAEKRVTWLEGERRAWRRKVAALEEQAEESLAAAVSLERAAAKTEQQEADEVQRAVAGSEPPAEAPVPAAPAPTPAPEPRASPRALPSAGPMRVVPPAASPAAPGMAP
jgi:outer membrane murein-binding lipoprotein Lpp